MTLTSEMSRIAAECEAAQGARLAAIAKVETEMRRDARKNKTVLARTMSAHRSATKTSLKDIFGLAAFTRGATQDMIERFGKEREASAEELHRQLDDYVAELHDTVSDELEHMAAVRTKATRRDANMRRAEIKDLRHRVAVQLAESDKMMANLHKDRARGERVWEQHAHDAPRQRKAATRKGGSADSTVHKRKHAHA
jgi:hypothetical protein